MRRNRLTLFDLDNTLLDGDSDYHWAQYLIAAGVLDGVEYAQRNEAYYQDYLAGRLDIHDFLDFELRPLARFPLAQLLAWRERFVQTRILPIMLPTGRERVREHLEAGDLVAIVTATNSFVTRPIADAFGVPHLIATEPEFRDGRYTGRVDGVPSFREGKLTRLNDWLAEQGGRLDDFHETWFYSDSRNDLPLLQAVSN